MCLRATCTRCESPTFIGCGLHVEQVLGDVPQDARCGCKPSVWRRASWTLFGAAAFALATQVATSPLLVLGSLTVAFGITGYQPLRTLGGLGARRESARPR